MIDCFRFHDYDRSLLIAGKKEKTIHKKGTHTLVLLGQRRVTLFPAWGAALHAG